MPLAPKRLENIFRNIESTYDLLCIYMLIYNKIHLLFKDVYYKTFFALNSSQSD